jgi:hypothetical protein
MPYEGSAANEVLTCKSQTLIVPSCVPRAIRPSPGAFSEPALLRFLPAEAVPGLCQAIAVKCLLKCCTSAYCCLSSPLAASQSRSLLSLLTSAYSCPCRGSKHERGALASFILALLVLVADSCEATEKSNQRLSKRSLHWSATKFVALVPCTTTAYPSWLYLLESTSVYDVVLIVVLM